MKGNLTIDNGNTSVKVAFFIGTQVVATNRFVRRDVRLLDRFISSRPVNPDISEEEIMDEVKAVRYAK